MPDNGPSVNPRHPANSSYRLARLDVVRGDRLDADVADVADWPLRIKSAGLATSLGERWQNVHTASHLRLRERQTRCRQLHARGGQQNVSRPRD